MAQTTTVMPEGRQRYYNNDGTPCAGGKLWTYTAGTTALKATYADADGTIANPNPVPLDAHGEATIYWTGAYKVDLKQADGQQVTGYPVDNLRTDPAGIWGAVASLLGQLGASTGAGLVGFIQNGAGAVAHWVLDKLRERVSVLDFMTDAQRANCLTRTANMDVSDAINKAIASVAPGGLVEFPAAAYYVNKAIQNANKVSLRGAGKSASEIWLGPNGVLSMTGTADAKIGYCTIEGLGITNQGGGPAYGLKLQYAFGITVRDCVVYNTSTSVSGFNYVTFDGCDFYTGQLYFDHPDVNQISEALKVTHCKGSGYAVLGRDTADVMIDHTHLLGATAQIWIQRGDQVANFYPPVWIDHTVVDSGDNEGVILSGVCPHLDHLFVSCGRTNNKNGIVLTDCTEGAISNTQSRFNGANGLFLRLCHDLTIGGNTFNDNKANGVSIGDSDNLRFVSNTMTNAATWYGGSYPQQIGLVDEPGNCTNITVAHNRLDGNVVGPLYLPGTTNTLHGNSGFGENVIPGTVLRAGADNTASVGTAGVRYSTIYAATSAISTSDERAKEQRAGGIDTALLRAWGRVHYAQYKFIDAVARKGESGARWHIGVIAQRVKEAFEAEGLDAFSYGLLCYDEWGNGNRYGIRYEEALALECAYLRSKLPS